MLEYPVLEPTQPEIDTTSDEFLDSDGNLHTSRRLAEKQSSPTLRGAPIVMQYSRIRLRMSFRLKNRIWYNGHYIPYHHHYGIPRYIQDAWNTWYGEAYTYIGIRWYWQNGLIRLYGLSTWCDINTRHVASWQRANVAHLKLTSGGYWYRYQTQTSWNRYRTNYSLRNTRTVSVMRWHPFSQISRYIGYRFPPYSYSAPRLGHYFQVINENHRTMDPWISQSAWALPNYYQQNKLYAPQNSRKNYPN